MPYYGDVSGDLRGLLNDEFDRCVVAVVAGSRVDCQRCPKRTVRNITRIDEAKWNELKYVEKRRFMECLSDCSEELSFGYATFIKSQLQSIQHSHRLYQEQTPPVWDIALRGYAYSEIIRDLLKDGERAVFYPDQFASKKQQEQLETVVDTYTTNVSVSASSSEQRKGIQAADCLAGGIREEKNGAEPWTDYLDNGLDTDNMNRWSMAQLSHRLSEM